MDQKSININFYFRSENLNTSGQWIFRLWNPRYTPKNGPEKRAEIKIPLNVKFFSFFNWTRFEMFQIFEKISKFFKILKVLNGLLNDFPFC